MNFPTLFEFAVEAVAEGFNRGTISIPFCLDSRPSDAIYKELLRLNSEDIKILKNFKNILNITKIEIDCLETYDVLNLSSFSLKSLTLKNIAKLYLKLPDRTHEGAISVDQFLKKVLNENSNNGLIHLGLTGSDRLTGNWVNEIAGLFPSLQSIDISETTFCQDFQFSVFCMAFPNIRVLNISNTNITSLLGIQNLQNLESLKMCNVYIACIDCYKELSELKKLTYLDISKTEISNHRYDPFYKIIKNLLDSEVRMDQLRCIDCSCTVVTRYELVTFSQRHPNLETVVALENMNETTVIPNVNLLNFCETGDILKSLHYSISNRKHNFISTCLQELKSILRFNFNDMSRSELADSMKVMLCIMETHYVDSWTRYDAVGVLSLMFQTGNLGKWSFLEIEIVLRRLFKQVNAMKRTMHMDIIQNLFGIVESIMNAVTARQQIPDALLSVIFLNITKAFTITPDMCLFYLPVLTKLQTEIMNWEQQCMSDDVKYVIAVFEMVDNVFAKREYRHYGGCLKILQFILERSEKRTISIPFLLDAKCCDAILKELNPNCFKLLKDFKNKLSITKIDMKCSEDVDMKHLAALNLVSLSLREIENLYDQFSNDDSYPVIDIVSALKVALNENSRKSLAHLGVSGGARFPKNWAREISELLPSLQSIDISRRKFNKSSRFPNFCMHFPNIRVLDISSSTIQSLKGIKSLQNLEVLKMCNVDIAHSNGFKELSRLKKLRYLDVSNTEDLSDTERVMPRLGVLEMMLDAGVEMEQLMCIDCSQTAVTPMDLQRFAQRHPKLETAVVMETLAQEMEIIGVNIFNYCTEHSLLKSLSYSVSTKKSFFIQKCLRILIASLDVNFEIYEQDEFEDCLKMIISILDGHALEEDLKGLAVRALSKMFKTENLDKWSFLEIEMVLRRLFKKCKAMDRIIYTNIINDCIIITESVLNSITVGQLIPDSLLDVIFLETLSVVTKNSEVFINGYRIWERLLVHKMSWEQFISACENGKYVDAVVEMMARLLAERKWTYYSRSVDVLNFMLASESSKLNIMDTDVHIKIMRQFKILHLSKHSLQNKLLRIVLFLNRFSSSCKNLM